MGRTETVLVVEDEEDLRDLAREILELQGYAVLEARHPGDALGVAERHAGPIHLLLTDVIMPGMSGRDLAARLAAVRPETKVVYMSGYADNALAGHSTLEDGTAFLQKPFTPDALAGTLGEVLHAAPGDGSGPTEN